MKIRTLLLSVLTAGLAQGAATAALAGDPIQIMIHSGPESTDLAVVKVDGKPDGRYNKVLTGTLEYDVYVRGDRPKDGTAPIQNVWLEGGESSDTGWTPEWEKHTLTMPYQDPSGTTAIKLCNNRLEQTSGAAREKFLKKGETFVRGGAYMVYGVVEWIIDRFPNYDISTWHEEMSIPVKIKCLGLNRNEKDPEEVPNLATPPLPPLFAKTTFKIEPAKIVKDGKFLCPTELKLYGYVETNRKFRGKALFVGPHYLSAVTDLHFSYADRRNVVATYPVKWHQIGGLTTTSDPKPKEQKLVFRFNIADENSAVIKSMTKTVQVSCGKIKPNGAAASDEMSVAPSN